jgi:tetratricopeptide (TPR) repeat protein
MRLLHFDALGKLVLTDFRSKPTPPYAILSHRWSKSEALIEDITSGAYMEKKEGYKKLKFCSEQAVRDKLQYFWIDTCCIDKWNLSELSKAINSMFQWYTNAARCYVFLSDVSVPTATEPVQQSDWQASFRNSAWFTRGWTLQELIAPATIEFFTCEGQRIGDKTSLDQLLHEITGVPLAALHNCPLDQFSIDERRQWARNRVTTEEEDIVYCLLGLLGVSMPTAYGEGKESASRRLQAEVEGVGSAPSIIPFSRNEHFVGREVQIAEAEAKLFSNDQSTTTLAIVGPGGTGKSQLALEVAHRTRQNNKSCAIFWIDASDKDGLYQSYASVAQKLRISGWEDDQADMRQVVKHCVAELSKRQCLLIFDNVEDIIVRPSSSSKPEGAQVVDYLPQSVLCSVVFTTTNSNIAETLAPQNVTVLQELLPETAQRMLQNRLSRPLSNTEQQVSNVLLKKLLYLPIAVEQAAACMDASSITVQEYQAQLDEYREVALESNSDSPQGKLLGSGTEDAVAATLFVSIGQVHRTNAVAAECLFFAACVERKDISLNLLDASSVQVRENAIKVLERYALITRRPAESAFDVHRLVHDALRKRLQAERQFSQWTGRAVAQLLRVFPSNDYGNNSKWRRLLPHAQCALSHSRTYNDNREEGEEEEKRLELVQKCAMTLYSDGRYQEAEELFVQVMESRKSVLGVEHPDTLLSMANLGSTYRNQGRWKEAEELGIQVMEMSKRVLGDQHPDTLTSTNNLALTYINQGRWKEAEELGIQVMEMSKRVLGDQHPDTMKSMNNLALTYSNQGRRKEAEKLFVQVMETFKRVLGDQHPDTLTSMSNLVLTFNNQGRWNEAEELGIQVMEMRKRVLGDQHPDTLTSMNNLASTYWNQGRWKEAEELFVQVTETCKRVFGDKHPDTMKSMNNLASTYRNQGRWKEAEELGIQVMEMRKRVLGDQHPDTMKSMNNLASTYWNQGRWKEAEELFVQVMETCKRVFGDEHPDTLAIMHNLAYTLQSQARYDEAIVLMERCFRLRQQILGEQHPSTQLSLNALNNWRVVFR